MFRDRVMFGAVVVLVAGLLVAAPASAQVCNPPPIPNPGQTVTWSGSVEICEDVTIPGGGTVEVAAGTTIDASGFTVAVEGTMSGIGTAPSPITLTSTAVFPPALEVSGTLDIDFLDVPIAQIRGERGGAVILTDCSFTGGGTIAHFGGGTAPEPPFYDITRCTFDGSAFDSNGAVKLTDVTITGSYLRTGGSLYFDNVTVDGYEFSPVIVTGDLGKVYLDGINATNNGVAGLELVSADFEIGPNVTLTGNNYPVELISSGILGGSNVPTTGNVNNYVLVDGDGDRFGPNTWGKLDVPYVITGGYTQRGGGALSIEPGVTVLLQGGASMASDPMDIIARGTEAEPVVFDRFDPAVEWVSLTQLPRLEHCVVNGSFAGVNYPLINGWVESCVLSNNQTAAQGVVNVRGTQFIDNGVGLEGGIFEDARGETNPNSFTGNTLAVDVADDASHNWWGSPSGPTTSENPGGTGDPINPGVPFQPFRTVAPDFTDSPPRVDFNGIPGVIHPGEKVHLSWNGTDDGTIVEYRVTMSPGANLPGHYADLAVLPGDTTTFEWTAPDIGYQFLHGQYLRIVAVDDAGQEGWDEIRFSIPSGRTQAILDIAQDIPPGTYVTGADLPDVEFTGETWFIAYEADGWFDGQGAIGSIADAQYISTDLARIGVISQDSSNDINILYSDSYFSIRPDSRLGDAPPVVDLLSPAPGITVTAGDTVPVTWSASDDEALRSFAIQVSYTDGTTWSTIASDLPPTATSFNWHVPPGSGKDDVRLRVIAHDLRFQSTSDGTDQTFTVLPTPGVPNLVLRRGDINFLNAQIGLTDELVVPVSNTGTAPLTVTSLTTTNPKLAVAAPTTPFTVLPGATTDVVVQYSPTLLGESLEDRLIVTTNDPEQAVSEVRIQGNGVNVNAPLMRIQPESINFGDVPVGTTTEVTLNISNHGNQNLEVASISTIATGFEFPTPTPFTVPPGGEHDLTVRWTPSEVGQAGALLVMSHNDSTANSTIEAVGNAIPDPGPVPGIDSSTALMNFGSVAIGNSSSADLLVTNTGTAVLTVTDLVANDPTFTVTSPATPFTVAPGSSATVNVTFTPSLSGFVAGALQIHSDAFGTPTLDVRLDGTGTGTPQPEPDIAVSPTSVGFGDVVVGNSADQTVTVSNVGTADLDVTALTATGTGFSVVSPATPFTVAPSGSTQVTVRFTPAASGAAVGSLVIDSTDPDEPSVAVSLTGNGTATATPDISLSTTTLDVGTVDVGSSGTATVTVSNLGGSDLTINSISATPSQFSVTAPSQPAVVSPGGSTDVIVQFVPTASGAVTGSLTIDSDDPDEPSVAVTLQGTGTEPGTGPLVAINAGGTADYTATDGVVYATDVAHVAGTPGYVGGRAFTFTDPVAGTTDDALYQTMRGGRDFSYVVDGLAAGDYEVTLHFMEPTESRTGRRVFDVTSEGTLILDNFDIFAVAGQLSAHTETFSTTVSDGALDLAFSATSRQAMVAAIEVAATGTPNAEPNISVAPASVSFGTVSVGAFVDAAVTITNTGDADLDVTATSVADIGFSLVGTVAPFTLTPGGSQGVTVRFEPPTAGAFATDLTITSSDPDQPTVLVPLSGTGSDTTPTPDITVSPASVAFGDVVVGASAAADVTITNDGSADLFVSAVTATGSDMTVSVATPTILTPGASMVATVTFTPTTTGAVVGDLTISSDDPDEASVIVSLSGTGVAASGSGIHINAGGDAYTATSGTAFVADQAHVAGSFGYVGGSSNTWTGAVAGTEDDVLYQTTRRGSSFSYVFDGLSTGTYDVTLYFMEPRVNRAGGRVLDVTAEGVVVVDDLDIFSASGGLLTAYDTTVTVSVTDGQLNLDFTAARNAIVSAVSVVPAAAGVAAPFV